ncbi:MAG: hypothetical protein ACI3YK_05000 [Eubacteriales bacterium]
MKSRKRIIGISIAVVVLIGIVVHIVATNLFPYGYNILWIKGKTAEEVIEKYGEFDRLQSSLYDDDRNGKYVRITCVYVVREAQRGYLGTTPEEWFCIYFDENGLADRCYVRTGGIGG